MIHKCTLDNALYLILVIELLLTSKHLREVKKESNQNTEYQRFIVETAGELEYIEQLLLGMHAVNQKVATLNELIKSMQQIKVNGLVLGYMELTELSYKLEYLLTHVLDRGLVLTEEHIDSFLRTKEALSMQLKAYGSGTVLDVELVSDVHMMLNDAINQIFQ